MIKFHPEQRSVFLCDFRGFKVPEMVKKRPVVVLSEKLKSRDGLCSVVPLSTTPPKVIMPYHYKVNIRLPYPFDASSCWAKCDMIYTVSYERLEPFKNGRDFEGKRKYVYPKIPEEDFENLAEAVLYGLGIKEIMECRYSIPF